MHLTITTLIASAGVLLPSTLAFRDLPVSCVPDSNAFKPSLSSVLECKPSAFSSNPGSSSSFVSFQCDRRGSVIYDFKLNKVGIEGAILPDNGQFTIHGACFDGRRQVAHVDLYTPREANQKYSHWFTGMNRKCDIGSTSLKLRFWSYILDRPGQNECGKHLISPDGS